LRKVYLDHSATTPVRSEVAELVLRYMTDTFGNPSSVHGFGREARKGVEEARERVASLINADPREIVFTSGGTEADNLAIKGVALANRKKGRHIITSAIEHHAVLHTCEFLEKEGYEVTVLGVDSAGLVSPDDLKAALRDDTILVSIMMANNEMGAIQPIKELAAIARERGVYFHTDAVQAVGQVKVDVEELGVDLLSLSAHKIYGPKGVGALYVRRGTKIKPIAHGGGHERRMRAGTENVPGIVGLGLAAKLAQEELEDRRRHLLKLRDKLIEGILDRVEDVRLNGPREERLPNNVNISFAYVEGESILLNLDLQGIAASSGSACTSGSLEPSHVLLAMGISHELAHGSVRMSLGTGNSEEDIDYVLEVLPSIIERLRSMSPLVGGRGEEKLQHVQR